MVNPASNGEEVTQRRIWLEASSLVHCHCTLSLYASPFCQHFWEGYSHSITWHGKTWGNNDNRQLKLDSRNVSAIELTEFINGPYIRAQTKEESGVASMFSAQDNEGTEVPLTEMTNTGEKGERRKKKNRVSGIGWENNKFSLKTLVLKFLLIIENILSTKEKRQICRWNHQDICKH